MSVPRSKHLQHSSMPPGLRAYAKWNEVLCSPWAYTNTIPICFCLLCTLENLGASECYTGIKCRLAPPRPAPSSGGSRISPPGGEGGGWRVVCAPTQKIAIIFFKIFAENCMKMKEFGPRGVHVPGAPLRSSANALPRHASYKFPIIYGILAWIL